MSNLGAKVDRVQLERFVEKSKKPVMFLFLIFAFFLPVLTRENAYLILVLSLIGIYIIAVTGLDIVFGYSGQVSFGHAAFYGIGAYATAILTGIYGWSFWISLLIGIVVAALLAGVIGWPSVRLVHHFLALVTIGVGEIMRLIFLNATQITGGFLGIGKIPRPTFLGLDFSNSVTYLYLILVLTAAAMLVKFNIGTSRWGRMFNAIRTNPLAAESFGSPLINARTIAFVISAMFAALAGSLYASLVSYVSPDTFNFAQSTLFFTMVLIGGSGTLWGPVLGVVLLTFINQYGQQFEIYQGIFYGLMIIIIVVFLPHGFVGSLEDYYRDHIKAPARRGGRGVTIVKESGEDHG